MKRPAWDFKALNEQAFRNIYNIESVRASCIFNSADTSTEYLIASNNAGESVTLPHNWRDIMTFVGYWSVPGLFKYTVLGEQMRNRNRCLGNTACTA